MKEAGQEVQHHPAPPVPQILL